MCKAYLWEVKSLITAKTTKEDLKMAKKVEKLVKLQIPAGKATPAPPVGPALGQAGINIMGFTKSSTLVQLTKLV